MPAQVTNETTIRLADGQVLVLTENDKLEQSTSVTIFCDSPRCEARNQVTKSFSYKPSAVAGDDMKLPPESDQFMSLVLSVRSPSNDGSPKNFCGPQCVKDFLTYIYLPPAPRHIAEKVGGQEAFNLGQKLSELVADTVSEQPPVNMSLVEDTINEANKPEVIPCSLALVQADGDSGDEHK